MYPTDGQYDQTSMLDPQRRAQMAMALAGGGQSSSGQGFAGPMGPIVQAMAMRQMQQPRSQMVAPGTAANGGWSTSVEPSGAGGGGGGLFANLKSMFGS